MRPISARPATPPPPRVPSSTTRSRLAYLSSRRAVGPTAALALSNTPTPFPPVPCRAHAVSSTLSQAPSTSICPHGPGDTDTCPRTAHHAMAPVAHGHRPRGDGPGGAPLVPRKQARISTRFAVGPERDTPTGTQPAAADDRCSRPAPAHVRLPGAPTPSGAHWATPRRPIGGSRSRLATSPLILGRRHNAHSTLPAYASR